MPLLLYPPWVVDRGGPLVRAPAVHFFLLYPKAGPKAGDAAKNGPLSGPARLPWRGHEPLPAISPRRRTVAMSRAGMEIRSNFFQIPNRAAFWT